MTMYGVAAGVVAEVVDVDDAGVVDARRRLGLVEEPANDLLVGRQLRQEELHGRHLAHELVLGRVDDAHAARRAA
jgi:hypothetical protein